MDSIHASLMDFILEQLCVLFENNLTYTRLTSFNHCSLILKFFLKQLANNYGHIVTCVHPRIRILIWQTLLHIRMRSSDSCVGMCSTANDRIIYGMYR
jgi:hypothetical protein